MKLWVFYAQNRDALFQVFRYLYTVANLYHIDPLCVTYMHQSLKYKAVNYGD